MYRKVVNSLDIWNYVWKNVMKTVKNAFFSTCEIFDEKNFMKTKAFILEKSVFNIQIFNEYYK